VPKSNVVTFETHEAYATAPLRPILRELRSRVLALDSRLTEGERCTAGHRIAYKIPGSKIFLEIKVHRQSLGLHLADGGQSDPFGITTEIPETHGWHQLKKRIKLTSMTELEAAMPFVEAAYRAFL
jgi:predicted transport protein